ncbi:MULTISPECIES: hypothetical protein [unclassified Ruegeria]|uniref:hypothetical protein n=1 Tax=unclassified Ruegeria TaxID=2625375 RepID=UPI00148907BA|nr:MULTISPECIES: hypothetical protein [unclassified Ruegeria]NOD63130.1 hypothetical protein [Ruegeria sp. HKCCD6109]NOD78015.1 hypothetical protein [Ruegeria sp. HKCCD4332]NOD87599.1 hypothetical protein [Ruegeria sp. HKCCD4318]NOD91696.1 hypothetical protein [Ruegeria sp. HKCCD4884]NOE15632.1 hypothetical protein [Ruegeria sp. HKCCD4318-2]
MTHVAEIVTFTLANGTTPEEFVKLSQASEAFVRSAPGFAHRQLSQGEDGRWTDYVVWTDMKAAKDAAAQFPQQDFCAGLMAAINPDSIQMRHENVLWNMTA